MTRAFGGQYSIQLSYGRRVLILTRIAQVVARRCVSRMQVGPVAEQPCALRQRVKTAVELSGCGAWLYFTDWLPQRAGPLQDRAEVYS